MPDELAFASEFIVTDVRVKEMRFTSARDLGLLGGRHLLRISRSHIGQLVGAGAIGQAIAFATSPLLTRIYSPADFGILGQYIAVSSVLQAVAAFRYDLSIPLAEDDVVAVRSLVLSLALTLVSTMAVVATLALGGTALLAHTKWAGVRPVLWLLPLSVLGGGAYQCLSYFAARQSKFGEIARTKVLQAGGASVAQIALGMARFGAIGLVFGQIANATLGLTRLFTRLRVARGIRDANLSVAALGELAKRRFVFAATYSLSAVVNQLGLGIHLILVGGMYGFAAAGQLVLASRLLAVVDLIVVPIGQVYYVRASEAHRTEYRAFRRLFFRTSAQLFGLGFVLAAGIWIAGPRTIEFIFGSQWQQAGLFFRYLSIFVFANVLCSPISMTLAVLQRPQIQLVWDIGRLAMVTGAFALARQLHFSATNAVLLFSTAAGLAMAVLYFVNLAAVVRGDAHG